MATSLHQCIGKSDAAGAVAAFDEELAAGKKPWDLHLSLFPCVQRVLNPPFVNPHLPKMYSIFNELMPRMTQQEVTALIRLGVREYARRPSLEPFCPRNVRSSRVKFSEIESLLADGDPLTAAQLMDTFCAQRQQGEFARRMLLLGSGYAAGSLGHSISCTGFILLEALRRKDQDLWPVITALAHYFHAAGFHTTVPLQAAPVPEEDMPGHLLRAVSGTGIVNLHHTITIYAVERVRHLLNRHEYAHMLHAWLELMGDKKAEPVPEQHPAAHPPPDYASFFGTFSSLDVAAAMEAFSPMLDSAAGRAALGSFLIRGACDMYDGSYNPHNLTGLGALLWVLDGFPGSREITATALHQYLDFLFGELRSGGGPRG